MRKKTTLIVLLAVLVLISALAIIVSQVKQKKEDIKKSGEVILDIPYDSVTALSWTNENGTFSFTKKDVWTSDDDAAFPADEDKIKKQLSVFESFAAAFTIDNVKDYSQYGLDEPVCTITVSAGDKSATVSLGGYSKMDSQRYISIGDGKAYLAVHDPLDEYSAVLSDMIKNDEIPDFDTAEKISFSGNTDYTIALDREGKSICADDIYYTDGKPLDTSLVNGLVSTVQSMSLLDYASYNVTEEELETYGLKNPDLTLTLDYIKGTDEENPEESGSFVLQISQNPEERAAYEEAVKNEEESLPEVHCYARLDTSQIVYSITEAQYKKLTAVSYDELRHQALFTADFDTALSLDVTLDGESYSFSYQKAEEKDGEEAEDSGSWMFKEEETDISTIRSALTALTADSFTEEQPSLQEEISLTIHLDNEDFPEYTLALYRYDGTECLAVIDGEPAALVPRKQAVDLAEAFREITLAR